MFAKIAEWISRLLYVEPKAVPPPVKITWFFGVAGVTHAGDLSGEDLRAGTALSLQRVLDNEYDAYAVAVRTATGTRVGWLPMHGNKRIAKMLDDGATFKVVLASKVTNESGAVWLIYIKVEEIDDTPNASTRGTEVPT